MRLRLLGEPDSALTGSSFSAQGLMAEAQDATDPGCYRAMTIALTLLMPLWAALSTSRVARRLCEEPLCWLVSCSGHLPIMGSGYCYLSPSSPHAVSSFLNYNRHQLQGWNRHCYSGTRMQAMQEFPLNTSLHYVTVTFPFSSSYFSAHYLPFPQQPPPKLTICPLNNSSLLVSYLLHV